MIVARMATVLRRRAALSQVIKTLLPQVDRLCIYQNDYSEAIDGCESSSGPDLGDVGKTVGDVSPGDYVFLVDDDILYPRDYCEKMIEHLQRYGGCVGVHGCVLNKKVENYFRDRKVFHFTSSVLKHPPIGVHVLGTGTTAYRSGDFDIDPSYPKAKNMLDIFFALKAQEQKIPMKIINRRRFWLKPAIQEDSQSLYRTRGGGEEQTKWINTVPRWSIF